MEKECYTKYRNDPETMTSDSNVPCLLVCLPFQIFSKTSITTNRAASISLSWKRLCSVSDFYLRICGIFPGFYIIVNAHLAMDVCLFTFAFQTRAVIVWERLKCCSNAYRSNLAGVSDCSVMLIRYTVTALESHPTHVYTSGV